MRGEKIRLSRRTALLCFLDEWKHKFVELVFEAMICVQRHVNGITLCSAMHVLGDGDRTERHVLEGRARRERTAARGYLDDAVAPAFGEPAQHSVSGCQRSDVNGGKREPAGARVIEHCAVGFVVSDWHGVSLLWLRLSIQCCP